MIQFSFGGNNLPQYTIELYVGNTLVGQKCSYTYGFRDAGNAIRTTM